jgi:hypothetical protein
LAVRNTQKAYLNCLEIRPLSILSLGNLIKGVYFIKICAIPTHIHIAIPIIQDSAKNVTLKPAEIQKIIENISTENMFEKLTSHELNVS